MFVSTCKAINKLPESVKSTIEMKEEPVEIENYMNVFSALYNQNWIGFQLDSKTKFKRFDNLNNSFYIFYLFFFKRKWNQFLNVFYSICLLTA